MAGEGSGEDEDVTSVDATPTMVQMPTTPSMPAPDTVAPQADVRPEENEHKVLPAMPQQTEDQKHPEEENPKK